MERIVWAKVRAFARRDCCEGVRVKSIMFGVDRGGRVFDRHVESSIMFL